MIMRTILATLAITCAVVLIGGAVFVYSGFLRHRCGRPALGNHALGYGDGADTVRQGARGRNRRTTRAR